MSPTRDPELAILLVTDGYDAIAEVLRCLRTDPDPDRLELVIAVVGGMPFERARVIADGFPHVRILDGGDGDLAIAEARACRAATAPWVVFAQAHAFPRPGFAEAILTTRATHPWTVIGPAMANANPGTIWSRAAMWINYGRWTEQQASGPRDDVPGHNAAYDRAALLALGAELDASLEAGWRLQRALQAHGAVCGLQPAACVAIVNPPRLWAFLGDLFRLGRLIAGQRRRGWSVGRRLVYAVGAPLIPFVRLARLLATRGRRAYPSDAVRLLPAVVTGLFASAAGEMAGYLLGAAPMRFAPKARA